MPSGRFLTVVMPTYNPFLKKFFFNPSHAKKLREFWNSDTFKGRFSSFMRSKLEISRNYSESAGTHY